MDKFSNSRILSLVIKTLMALIWLSPETLSAEVIRAGIYDNKPKVFVDEDGKPAGFFVDITEEIAKRNNFQVEYVYGTWADNLAKLERGELDVLLDVSYSDERAKNFVFNEVSVIESWYQVFTDRESRIERVMDLKGKTIAVLENSVQHEYVKTSLKKFFSIDYKVAVYSSYTEGLKAVLEKKADCFLGSRFFYFSKDFPDYIVAKPIVLYITNIYYAFRKDFDKNRIRQFDAGLFTLKNLGNSAYYRSFNKWFAHEEKHKLPAWLKTILIGIPFLGLLIVLFVSIWNRQLKKEVGRKTSELYEKNQALSLFKESLENSADAIGMSNPAGLHYYQNQAFTKLFGDIGTYPPETLYVNREEGERIFKVIQSGEQWVGEVKMYSREKQVLDVFLRAYPNKDNQGQITALVGIHTDITKTKQAEKLLREREDFIKRIYESSHIPIVVMDAVSHKYIDCNPAAVRIYGFASKEETLGKTPQDVSAPLQYDGTPSREKADFYISQGLEKGAVIFEWRHQRADGTLWDAEVHLLSFDVEAKKLIQFSLINITERKRAEEGLKESNRQLSTLLANLPGVSYRCRNDRDWSMIFISEGCLELTGYERDSLQRNTPAFGTLILPEDREFAWNTAQEALAAHKHWELEYRIRHKDGSYRYVWEKGRGVYDESDTLLYLDGFISDITERKKLQEQLIQSQKMESVGRLAGGIAHDFNNMLGGIMNAAELIGRFEDSKEKVRKYAELIKNTSSRASDLISKLLAFSRKTDLTVHILDINEIVSDTRYILERSIDKKIRIENHIKTTRPYVEGETSLIHNALLNMGINSSHAMPEGGILTFTTKNVFLDEAFCRKSHFEIEPGEYVEIEIKDTGSGIARENLDKIFEPFFTTKEPGKGTGLGLSAIYGLAREYKGAVTVESDLGKGTTFHVYLPLSEKKKKASCKDVILEKGQGVVLLADDEEIIRLTCKDMLEELGYEVLMAENGREAVEIFKRNLDKIDIVILDMIMPEMGGREAFFKIREIKANAHIIVASGFFKEDEVAELERQGLNALIGKPYSMKELSQVLKRLNTL